MKDTDKKYYLHLDGDGIGDRLELYLLDDKVVDAVEFSQKVKKAISKVCATIESVEGAEIILVGGDDIIAVFDEKSWDVQIGEKLREIFYDTAGCTLSIGIGLSVQESLNNLRRAKLSGKNKIVIVYEG